MNGLLRKFVMAAEHVGFHQCIDAS
jgi:hypothetical protein